MPSNTWYNGEWHNANWFNDQWYAKVALSIDDVSHEHQLQHTVIEKIEGDLITPFYQWNTAATRKILFSFSLREIYPNTLFIDDLLHTHELTETRVRLNETVFILDDPDSIEVGAGWETVV